MENEQEEMFRLIREWQKTDVSQKEFFTQKGFSYYKYRYWVRKWRLLNPQKSDFIAIPSIRSVKPTNAISIYYPNGVKIELGEIDYELLSQLIKIY